MDTPYAKLLGLNKEIEDPDYYEMLGLKEGLLTEKQLENAYKKRIQNLQRLGNNPKYKDTVLYLKGELRNARATLSSPVRKSEYDLVLLTQRVEILEKECKLLNIKGYMVEKEVLFLEKRARELKIPRMRLQKILQKVKIEKNPVTTIIKGLFENSEKNETWLQKIYHLRGILLLIGECVALLVFLVWGGSYIVKSRKLQRNNNYSAPSVENENLIYRQKNRTDKKNINRNFSAEREKKKPNDIKDKVIFIDAGFFRMGNQSGSADERPVRKIYQDSYYIGRYEVSNREYRTFVRATGHSVPSSSNYREFNWDIRKKEPPKNRLDYPVVLVNWHDANAYCQWLSRKTAKNIRLPTEAQWEKAARGTESYLYPWGQTIPKTHKIELGNFAGKDDGFTQTAPTGSFPWGISPYGCWDMAGNVAEWCRDSYDQFAYQDMPSHNPYIEHKINNWPWKTLRGSSWKDNVEQGRSSIRKSVYADQRDPSWGFRYAVIPKNK